MSRSRWDPLHNTAHRYGLVLREIRGQILQESKEDGEDLPLLVVLEEISHDVKEEVEDTETECLSSAPVSSKEDQQVK